MAPGQRNVPPALRPLATVTTGEVDALRTRLAAYALARGVLEVGYRRYESPVGDLVLAATPIGLVRVAFARDGVDDVVQALADGIGPRILEAPAMLDDVARQLDAYFAGEVITFDVPLDGRLSRGFRAEVLARLPDIGYGHTASYAAVAAAAGRPAAVRAVGSACATNPHPIVVPCHRVVKSDGSMGAYLGGVDAKRYLLDLEAGRAG